MTPATSPRDLALIVAVAQNGTIGKDGDLPWHLPADLKHFKRLTTGHTMLMGRKTWQSIGRPLPKRRSIVLTRDRDFEAPGADVVHDLDAALALTSPGEKIFVIGGSSLYAATLPLAGILELTRVHADVDGDVSFPDLDWSDWRLDWSEDHPADERHAHAFTFERYVRK